ncbi:hypothetical protein [Pseudomonas avellanae]|uniref:Uncharacterized protein n=1 Tax=Pseudomonas avellanae TaxID=46257 RepID=A0A3M5U4J6_9PSED|nr:hypothetical protein [Pseudomonas avellanae]RMU40108.1 hypothetical protein ALP32_200146 [Pseudomonas avellanae]UQW69284.1 hypothetical protein L2Y00_01645 [Pseudomonas avellanae]UQW71206.1 hypothetical protein L2Y00_12740 [Pseudomonas avellanae]GGJ53457.1 hypothetical protein GCM10009085_53510 [Pseudomonas avellanae]
MTQIHLPDGTEIIDDSELMPSHQARRMASEGMPAPEIATALELDLPTVELYLSWGPYESPEAYWMRRYNAGTHLDDEYEDE